MKSYKTLGEKIIVYIPKHLQRAIKMYCIRKEISISALVRNLLNEAIYKDEINCKYYVDKVEE